MWIIETKTEPTTAVITISLGNSTVAIVTAFIASLEYDKPPTTAKIIAAKYLVWSHIHFVIYQASYLQHYTSF